jgi:hypothetical protein
LAKKFYQTRRCCRHKTLDRAEDFPPKTCYDDRHLCKKNILGNKVKLGYNEVGSNGDTPFPRIHTSSNKNCKPANKVGSDQSDDPAILIRINRDQADPILLIGLTFS